ncbi:Sensor histidine kinase [Acanthopleuribacter pedis]
MHGDIPNQDHPLKQTQSVLFKISALISRELPLDAFYQSIHELVGELMPADNFYIAVREPESDTISFPYHRDEMDEAPEPRLLERVADIDSSHPTDYVFRTGQPKRLLMDEQENLGLNYDAGTLSVAWLGVPVKNQQGETFGVIAVQVYHGDWVYGQQEMDILVYVSQNLSAVLEIRWKNLALAQANRELREANQSLEAKVAERTAGLETALASLAQNHQLLEENQEELLEQAHAAGMADIASSVLHNIGNMLNQSFVAATHLHDIPTPTWIGALDRITNLIEQEQLLAADHPKSQGVLDYLRGLTKTMGEQHGRHETEVADLTNSLRLIRGLTESQASLTHTDTFYAVTRYEQTVQRVLALFSTRIEAIPVTVATHYADSNQENLPTYTIKRAMAYLIENALDALIATEQARLTIRMTRTEDGTQLTVEDNGRGVAPEHLDAVCKLGFSTKGRHGFGLHYACNALASVGAKLSFESTLGEGTRVTLRFPRYAAG